MELFLKILGVLFVEPRMITTNMTDRQDTEYLTRIFIFFPAIYMRITTNLPGKETTIFCSFAPRININNTKEGWLIWLILKYPKSLINKQRF